MLNKTRTAILIKGEYMLQSAGYGMTAEDIERRDELLAERAPLAGKWLWIAFWLLVPSFIGSVMKLDQFKKINAHNAWA